MNSMTPGRWARSDSSGRTTLVTLAAPFYLKKCGESEAEGHRLVRGGAGAAADPGDRERVSRAAGAGELLPVCLPRLSRWSDSSG